MNETAFYKGHKAVKYGRSSLIVFKDDHEIFHTGRRNEKACKDLNAWLKWFVDKGTPGLQALAILPKDELEDDEDDI